MPRDRGRRTPTRTTPTLSQLKATYAAKAKPVAPAPKSIYPPITPQQTQPAVPSPARPPAWAPYAPAAAEPPSVQGIVSALTSNIPRPTGGLREAIPPTTVERPWWAPYANRPVAGAGAPGYNQYDVIQRDPGLPWMQTGYDPAIRGIPEPLQQQYMPTYWAATEQERARKRYEQAIPPPSQWPEPKTADAPWTPPPPSIPGGGGGGAGGYGGTVYRRPTTAGGGRGVVGRGGLVMWRIGI